MFLYILNKHIRGVAQFGSAFGSGPKGRKFKSCHSDHTVETKKMFPTKKPDFIGLFCHKYSVKVIIKEN